MWGCYNLNMNVNVELKKLFVALAWNLLILIPPFSSQNHIIGRSANNFFVKSWMIHTPVAIRSSSFYRRKRKGTGSVLLSTPFEMDYYDKNDGYGDSYKRDDDDTENPFDPMASKLSGQSPLRVPSDTKLVIGLNKYSHDTSICAAEAKTGNVLFALSKERITRKKHDSGNTASLLESCLDSLHLDIETNIEKVVMNNHHHRILPNTEADPEHMEWECGLAINGGAETGYDDEENTLFSLSKQKYELSHHLAHAYSVATQCPFEDGMVVVMDGMGETYRTMLHSYLRNDTSYISDFNFLSLQNSNKNSNSKQQHEFECIPNALLKEINDEVVSNNGDNLQNLYHNTYYYDYREAESVYTFTKYENNKTIDLRPVFKRFSKENSPPTLYNHGFENMDSIGAVYSRVSSHIFGDWNVCGKVMGLSPWYHHEWSSTNNDKGNSKDNDNASNTAVEPLSSGKNKIMKGNLYVEDQENENRFQIDRTLVKGIPFIARNDPDLIIDSIDKTGNRIIKQKNRYDFDDNDENVNKNDKDENGEINTNKNQYVPTKVALDAIRLSHMIQSDLEDVGINFVKHFKEKTKKSKICLAGGVALNSILNGRISRELFGADNTYIPPYPGDDGIALGCCMYGLYGNLFLDNKNKIDTNNGNQVNDYHKPTIRINAKQESSLSSGDSPVSYSSWNTPIPPYLGPLYTEDDIEAAINEASPWLEIVKETDNIDELVDMVSNEIESGSVIAWYQGRSELGPRALGHRSILADPRKKGLVRFINKFVKKRECFRPFAPSVLAEHVEDWFDIGKMEGKGEDGDCRSNESNVSPYMSITAYVHEKKRQYIPAVTHIADGSSRLQSVREQDEPIYHRLISSFYEKTRVPMVLNTSFNTLKGEPIVETPKDAIRSFLSSMGSLDWLVFVAPNKKGYILKRKRANLPKLLGEVSAKDYKLKNPASIPKRAGDVYFRSSFQLLETDTDDESENGGVTTEIRMPSRPTHDPRNEDGQWFKLLDELEGEALSLCDGKTPMDEIMAYFSQVAESESEDESYADELLQNVIYRMLRLYEHTFIHWD